MISHRDEDYDDDAVPVKSLLLAMLSTGFIIWLWIFISSLHIPY